MRDRLMEKVRKLVALLRGAWAERVRGEAGGGKPDGYCTCGAGRCVALGHEMCRNNPELPPAVRWG